MNSIPRTLLLIAVSACVNTGANAQATETLRYPTNSDGSRNYAKPAYKTDKSGLTYPTNSDGSRNYSKPAYKTDGTGLTYPTNSDGSRNYSKPVYKNR